MRGLAIQRRNWMLSLWMRIEGESKERPFNYSRVRVEKRMVLENWGNAERDNQWIEWVRELDE